MKEKITILRLKKLLLEYQKKEMLSDEFFVLKSIDIILKTYGLQDFIENIVFYDSKYYDKGDAYYNPIDKLLGFDINNMVKTIEKYENFKGKIMTNKEYVLTNNVLLLKNIIHEIEHIKQMSVVLRDNDDIKSRLLKIEFYDAVALLGDESYDKNYLVSYLKLLENEDLYFSKLGERLAFSNSFLMIKKILSNISLKEADVSKKVNCFDYINNINSFYNSDNNLYTYVDKINELNKNYNINEEINLSHLEKMEKELELEDRFLYGFPITKSEFKKIQDKSKKSYK